MSLDTEITAYCFLALLHLRVLLYGEIKRYKSPIRIRIENISMSGGGVANAKLKYPLDASDGYNKVFLSNKIYNEITNYESALTTQVYALVSRN